MALEKYLTDAAARTKVSFSNDRGKFADYLINHDLKDYFSDKIPEEEKARLKSSLEKKLNASIEKYKEELGGMVRKASSRGTMGLAVLNDIAAYTSKVPLLGVTGLGYALFGLKSIAELPAIRRYIKKSHDKYGALKHILMKPINYLIPVVGPAIEAGSFERMVKKRVLNEAKSDFIKENGNYVSFEEKLKEGLKTPIYAATNPQYSPQQSISPSLAADYGESQQLEEAA